MTPRTYTIVRRYYVADEGWKHKEHTATSRDYEGAAREAAAAARALDATYGADHFWTVDLTGEHGAYFQLFHGRLS